MPLRLNVGVSKKLGLPAYSSIGASCNLDLESAILRDPAGFRDQVQGAFAAAREAGDDELARLQALGDPGVERQTPPSFVSTNGTPARNGHLAPRPGPARERPGKAATASQVRAITAIARRRHADLDGLLRDLGVNRPEELSLAEASRLIDQLKAASQA
jgi:hypothetical protein